jgi:nucleotide-binding universal stress UspA family protein
MSAGKRPTILVGVSGSPASDAALRWAGNEAEHRHGRLRIMLIWHPEQRAFYAHPARSPDGSNGGQRAQRHLSETVRAVLGPTAQPDATVEVVEGVAERTLVAESAAADLLVLGSGPGVPVGPVIRACLFQAHCPVVVVSPRMLNADEPQQLRSCTTSGGYSSPRAMAHSSAR